MKSESNKVTLVRDPDRSSRDIVQILRRYHDVDIVAADTAWGVDFSDSLLVVFDVDLNHRERVERLRSTLDSACTSVVPRIFTLNKFDRREVMQVHSLGSPNFIVRPLQAELVLQLLRSLINGSVENRWEDLNTVQKSALKVSLKVFEDMMAAAFAGEPMPTDQIRESCSSIIKATAHDDLAKWITAVRDHHNYTFRHTMMVCGFLNSFAHLLGITGSDLESLAQGGLLHDVGKAFTPLDLLNKPGQLTPEEWKVMRLHSVHSRKILEESGGLDPVVVDVAAHHHEKLDGTGYPDGLEGEKISDPVRMISIADVFSALVDKRTYKKPMDGKDAWEIMLTMEGQLDIPLVRAFKPIALAFSKKSAPSRSTEDQRVVTKVGAH